MAHTRFQNYHVETYSPVHSDYEITKNFTHGQLITHTSDPFHLLMYPFNLESKWITNKNKLMNELKSDAPSSAVDFKENEEGEKNSSLGEQSYRLFLKKLDQQIYREKSRIEADKKTCVEYQIEHKERETKALGEIEASPTFFSPPLEEIIPSKIQYSYLSRSKKAENLAKSNNEIEADAVKMFMLSFS